MYRKCFDIIASKLDEESIFCMGIKLNLPNKDVDEICSHNVGIDRYQKIYKILTSWQEQYGQQADLNQVMTILRDMNKNSIADKVEVEIDSSK